jgi:hypothetical protein
MMMTLGKCKEKYILFLGFISGVLAGYFLQEILLSNLLTEIKENEKNKLMSY